jgi:hypothetical protein
MMGSLAGAAAFVGLLVGAQACKVGTTVLPGLWTANAIPHWLPGHYIGLYGGESSAHKDIGLTCFRIWGCTSRLHLGCYFRNDICRDPRVVRCI